MQFRARLSRRTERGTVRQENMECVADGLVAGFVIFMWVDQDRVFP